MSINFSVGISLMLTPPIRISPSATSQKRGIRLATVDFPEPEGPTSAVISPWRAVKVMSRSASVRVVSALFS